MDFRIFKERIISKLIRLFCKDISIIHNCRIINININYGVRTIITNNDFHSGKGYLGKNVKDSKNKATLRCSFRRKK